ncbi:HAD-IIA family hydrolase, partial [Paenibacillus dendritiformis]
SYLQESKIEFYLLSNNSSYSKLSLSQKLSGMGIKVTEDQIILSTDGLIEYLQQEKITNTYVVGTSEMKKMFEKNGIDSDSKNPSYVVLGYDTDISYEKIATASNFLNKGIPLLATHCDVNCPTPGGPVPDIGSFLKMFEAALDKKPEKVFGKPNPEMIKHKINKFNHSNINSVVIGDRVYTDMILAKNCNLGFICVLSGETKREHIEDLGLYPDLIVNKAYDIIEKIKIKVPQKVFE